jgi:hypothetical protein
MHLLRKRPARLLRPLGPGLQRALDYAISALVVNKNLRKGNRKLGGHSRSFAEVVPPSQPGDFTGGEGVWKTAPSTIQDRSKYEYAQIGIFILWHFRILGYIASLGLRSQEPAMRHFHLFDFHVRVPAVKPAARAWQGAPQRK